MHWHLTTKEGTKCRYQRQTPDRTWERYAPADRFTLTPCELRHDHPCAGSTLNFWSQ